jgi:hypothetical protein
MKGRALDNDAVTLWMTQKRVQEGENATPGRLNPVVSHACVSPCRAPNADGGELRFDIRGEDIDGDTGRWSLGGDNRNRNPAA